MLTTIYGSLFAVADVHRQPHLCIFARNGHRPRHVWKRFSTEQVRGGRSNLAGGYWKIHVTELTYWPTHYQETLTRVRETHIRTPDPDFGLE